MWTWAKVFSFHSHTSQQRLWRCSRALQQGITVMEQSALNFAIPCCMNLGFRCGSQGRFALISTFFLLSSLLSSTSVFFYGGCTEMDNIYYNWSSLHLYPDAVATNCLSWTGFHFHWRLPTTTSTLWRVWKQEQRPHVTNVLGNVRKYMLLWSIRELAVSPSSGNRDCILN